MQVHDELVFEVPTEAVGRVTMKLREIMQGVARLDVGIVVEIGVGNNWDQAH
jgi:DNA polymerase-1